MYHAERMGGALTLAAVKAPDDRFDQIADIINAFPEVAHNYAREHELNLWFVVAADERGRVEAVLCDIERCSGLEVLELPLEEAYCLDLGFAIRWAQP